MDREREERVGEIDIYYTEKSKKQTNSKQTNNKQTNQANKPVKQAKETMRSHCTSILC